STLYSFLIFIFFFFLFNDPATTEIYTLSLHDALPISSPTSGIRRTSSSHASQLMRTSSIHGRCSSFKSAMPVVARSSSSAREERSEEHTSELQSRGHLVCRLLLEKKKKKT